MNPLVSPVRKCRAGLLALINEDVNMAIKFPIYMDHNATTPVDPRVLDAMLPYFCEKFGNAASNSHPYGWKAADAVENARQQVASLLGANAKDIVITSGATESDNLALKGTAEAYRAKGNHIITSTIEHKAVIDTCNWLEKNGCSVTWLKPDEYGLISAQQVADAITDETILVSLMLANNEVGTLNPLAEIGKITRERGVFFHTDATQAVGKIPINVDELGVDMLSMSGHKLYGPKGVGCLYVRRSKPRVALACQMHGGGHERKMRSGTLNVPGIVGMGMACEIAGAEMVNESARLTVLRDRLQEGIETKVGHVKLNGHPSERLPNTLNMSFSYIEGEALMMKIKDVAVSSGSACTSATLKHSHVLKEMGVADELSASSIRFSLGKSNSAEEIDYAIEHVAKAVEELREMSPLYELAMEQMDIGQ